MIKHSHAEAMPVAEQIVAGLDKYCVRIEIAGSLRRLVREVSDIEIVAIPKIDRQSNLFGDDFTASRGSEFNRLLERLDYLVHTQKISKSIDRHGRPSWGLKMRKFLVPTASGKRFKVDLFMCTYENWGDTLLIRTGSMDFSRFMVTSEHEHYTKEIRGAMPGNMRHREGRMWLFDSGEWLPQVVAEEMDWFDMVGMTFVPPDKRHDDQWLRVVHDNG